MAIAVETYATRQLERWPLLGKLESDAQAALRGLYHALSELAKEETPTNEFGIAIPHPYVKCMDEDCDLRGESEECWLDRDHLHSTSTDYQADSDLADEFRNLELLTVWVSRCVHENRHKRYRIHVPIPHPDVMRQAKYESGRVKKLVNNYRLSNGYERQLREVPDLTIRGRRSLNSIRDHLADNRERLLDEVVAGLDVIPEELVTGALLVVASDLAQRRMDKGMQFALPGLLNREEVSLALENARGSLAEAA